MADPTLLSWINAEVERALLLVRDSIAKFSAAPGNDEALRQCPEHLHQVSGALRMVGLNGATLVCETIEGSFGSNGKPNAKAVGVIDRAVVALKEFVGDLARGQADVPLRLYPVYRELAQLRGTGAVSEKDLFFPDLSPKAPPHRSPKSVAPDRLAAHVGKQRALFQRGLLAWLRKPPNGLEEMRRAVNHLHKVAAQLPEPQGVWWVAHGFLDALDNPPDKEWLAAAKALGTKIERQISAGQQTVSEALMRELLYAIAKCPPSTPRQKEIRALYQLDSLFPRADAAAVANVMEFDIERLEVALYDLHSRLDALKRAWVQYVSGEHKSSAHFKELVAGFKAKARDLGNQHFVKLLDAIAVVAPKLPDPYPRQGQAMVIEMASTFLLAEHIIDHFTAPAPDLEQQISIMGGWLLDAATGKSTGEPPPGLRPDFGERIGALQLRSQVAKEILANLQHVEQVLDAFSRDASKRATLGELQPYMRQMHGALVVLEFKRAAEALSICESMIAACAAEGYAKAAEDMDWIAEGLSSLGFFLEPCRHGREPVDEAIALFFRRYEKRNAPVSAETTSLLPPVKAKPEAARPNVDQDLLQVFLEEAEEVLQRIEQTVPECRKNPEDRESLTTVRRAFHTLKGSGRMVGLMDLGEVAWEVEQVMNLWLEQKRPATPDLLEFVMTAHQAFAGWIAALKENRLAREIDGKPIVDAALNLRKPKPAPADQVTVGEVTLPRNFFEIYTKEAAQHVAALEAQCAEWRKNPAAGASEEFMRAAHTLASSSRTAGFGEVADLAAALEHWTTFATQTSVDQSAVQGAIAQLRAMVEAVTRQQAPAKSMTATQELRSLVARLEAVPPPPPVETKAVAAPAPAQAGAPAEAGGREKRVMRDDIDQQLLPVFLEEAEELVPHLGSDLRDWKANPTDQNISNSLRRLLHTLKGSARMAGAIRLGELCHIMETRLEAALEANAFPPALFEELEEKMDRVSTDVERMRGKPAPVSPAQAGPAPAPEVQAAAPVQKPRVEPPLPTPAAMLRVNADVLDDLINESGEVAIARSRIEAELRVVKQSLSDLGESVARLRAQLREVEVQADSQMQSRLSVMDEKKGEYDPLEFDRYTRLQELTRLMAESLNDVGSIQQTLLKNLGDTDAALLQQGRIGREVQQELMRIRAVPFTNLNERLYRIVRQTARELDKKVELTVEGGELELDRGVLERIGAPLEHMLRNALAHGIEAPAARVAAGKPESGRISIALRQESNEMVMIITDDGGGLDLGKLRAKGEAMGLLRPGEERSDAEIAQLVFVSGLSTAEQVSELAGRGVGMDVVKSEISAIGGRVDILTTRGGGTTFTVYLPLTLAVTQAVLVRCGTSVLAISSAMVEQVLRVKADALTELYAAQTVSFQERSYPLHYARNLLGANTATEIQPYNSVLLLRSGVLRIALHIDELLANQEIVVKAIGPQLARVPGVVGATVLADGAIVLIVNPVLLAGRVRTAKPAAPVQPAAAAPQQLAPTIMVVDDSLTVRKFTTRLLEREGYRVATAKDGVDALEQIKDMLPSVMLVDIEMPRMDGFDLTRSLRADPRTQQLPIIVISSRTAEKHRAHAAQLGVNAFLGKPYPESELLQLIAQYARA